MKKSLFIVIAAISFLVNSCSNDLDITADWKEVTVVYGLLDPSQNVQYVRINKAFLDENTSALVLAKESDSLFHRDSISVILEEIETGSRITMEKVNADTIGINKNTGIFASNNNILYRTFGAINQNSTYKLIITNTRTGAVVTAQTSIIKDFSITSPTPTFPLYFGGDAPVNIEFSQPANADIYDLSLRFHYREVVKGTTSPSQPINPANVVLDTFVVWKVFSSKTSADLNGNCGGLCYKINGAEFYNFLANNIPVNPAVDRIADSVDFIFNVGGDELSKYIAVSQAQGNSITQTQASSPYSNINGGIGIFSSRYSKEVKNIPLVRNDNLFETIRKLACEEPTDKLGFLRVVQIIEPNIFYDTCP